MKHDLGWEIKQAIR